MFKPGQLCFFRIKELAKKIIKGTAYGILKERDGIPLLVENNFHKINGYLFYFYSGKENDAYQQIVEIEPERVYRWSEVKINNNTMANVLLGKRESRGSSDLEHFEECDGKSDPFFKQGLEEVEIMLKDNKNFDWEYRSLLRLQMAYVFLWSIIERYAGLKYHLGKKANNKVLQIAEEESFIKSLKRNVKNIREVFSTTDLQKYTLGSTNPANSIKYYYQVRSNAVHRGKAITRDFDTVKSSLEELLAIFKDKLKESFET